MFSPGAQSSSLAAELIKQVEQWLLILLVYIQIWDSSTSIKLWLWSDTNTTASCGLGSWCESVDQQFCVFSLSSCLFLSHTCSVLLEGSSDFLWANSTRKCLCVCVGGGIRLLSVNPTSGCSMLDDKLILEVYAAESRTQHPLLQ